MPRSFVFICMILCYFTVTSMSCYYASAKKNTIKHTHHTSTHAKKYSASLKGSKSALTRQNQFADSKKLPRYHSARHIRTAVRKGLLKKVSTTKNLSLANVSFPYATPDLHRFLNHFSQIYKKKCGEALVITSLTRPRNSQPRNASQRSVHPSGIAFDLRVPYYRCKKWLRKALMAWESQGYVEATREFRPPHFHVVVHPQKVSQWMSHTRTNSSSKSQSHSQKTRTNHRSNRWYKVRSGDSLWQLAQYWKVSVQQIKKINHLSSHDLQIGQRLRRP